MSDLLVEENLESMDAFIATTGDSETNILFLVQSKFLFVVQSNSTAVELSI